MEHRRKTSIFIIDDNENLVKSFVMGFNSSDFSAEGCSNPSEILNEGKRKEFKYDLILLDMYLGKIKDKYLNAPMLIPHLRTYYPYSKIVIYSSGDIDKNLCLRCLQLGAFTILPKTTDPPDLISIANVIAELGDQSKINEKLISLLLETVNQTKEENPLKGKHLEMLMINIFDSIPTFRVIGSNVTPSESTGESDIILENNNAHHYWKMLNSPIIVVECKNRSKPSDKNDILILADKVKAKGNNISKVGVLVSIGNVARSAREKIIELRKTEKLTIFTLVKEDVENLVNKPFFEREEYLRGIFGVQ